MDINPDKPPPQKRWGKNILLLMLFSLLMTFPLLKPVEGEIEVGFLEGNKEPEETPLILQENSVLALSSHSNPERKVPQKKWVVVTAYSSTQDQCDKDPLITASGSYVEEGIVAANFLAFETKIKIPAIYGEKVFIVKDRMHPRNSYHVDIWFPTRWQALNFGARTTYIEILEG